MDKRLSEEAVKNLGKGKRERKAWEGVGEQGQ